MRNIIAFLMSATVALSQSADVQVGDIGPFATEGWVKEKLEGIESITNGLASTEWVENKQYVTESVTNGLLKVETDPVFTNWVASTNFVYVDESGIWKNKEGNTYIPALYDGNEDVIKCGDVSFDPENLLHYNSGEWTDGYVTIDPVTLVRTGDGGVWTVDGSVSVNPHEVTNAVATHVTESVTNGLASVNYVDSHKWDWSTQVTNAPSFATVADATLQMHRVYTEWVFTQEFEDAVEEIAGFDPTIVLDDDSDILYADNEDGSTHETVGLFGYNDDSNPTAIYFYEPTEKYLDLYDEFNWEEIAHRQVTAGYCLGSQTNKLLQPAGEYALKSELSAHASSTNNPHGVTGQQLGILREDGKIANNLVNASSIANFSVVTGKINIGAVTTSRIADEAVTKSKLNADVDTWFNEHFVPANRYPVYGYDQGFVINTTSFVYRVTGHVHESAGNEPVAGEAPFHVEGKSHSVPYADDNDMGTRFRTTLSHIEGYQNSIPLLPSVSGVQGWQRVSTFVHLEGENNAATGHKIHVEGSSNEIKGTGVHVEGSRNKFKTNSAFWDITDSHIEGREHAGVKTYDYDDSYRIDNVHVEGSENKIYSNTGISHVEGQNNLLSGMALHVEGSHNVAGITYSGEGLGATSSHVEGERNLASGWTAHAEGALNEARGDSAHAEGYHTEALARAHAEGSDTRALDKGAHAGGNLSEATKYVAFAHGMGAKAKGEKSIALGSLSVADDNNAFTWNGAEWNSGAGRARTAEDKVVQWVRSQDYVSVHGTPVKLDSLGNQTTYYQSHGEGTFNINPLGGINGVWIGETNLNSYIAIAATNIARSIISDAVANVDTDLHTTDDIRASLTKLFTILQNL